MPLREMKPKMEMPTTEKEKRTEKGRVRLRGGLMRP